MDPLIQRQLNQAVGLYLPGQAQRCSGTEKHQRCAAVGDVGIGTRFAALDPHVDLSMRR